ncbi:MAG TPA: hypothetical protein VK645_00780 [Chitinophagaceae bacterium]|nr:hypothetical protein [Chitinophagaceae bacterium]
MGLDIVDLVMKIEKAFSIEVPDQRWEQVITVQDVYDVVWEYAGSKLVDKDGMIARINLILIDHIGCGPGEITPEKNLTGDLGLD